MASSSERRRANLVEKRRRETRGGSGTLFTGFRKWPSLISVGGEKSSLQIWRKASSIGEKEEKKGGRFFPEPGRGEKGKGDVNVPPGKKPALTPDLVKRGSYGQDYLQRRRKGGEKRRACRKLTV